MKAFGTGTLAIVGNGGNEIGKGRGEEIDSHDRVLRFNNFRTGPEWAADYGSRTDFWAWHFFRGHDYPHDPGSVAKVFCPMPLLDSRWPLRYGLPKYTDSYNLGAAYTLSSQLFLAPWDVWEALQRELPWPSTGMGVVWWAWWERGGFHKIDLYGFSHFDPAVAMHYFDPAHPAPTNHNGAAERNLFQKMAAEGVPA